MDKFSTWTDLNNLRIGFIPVGSLEQHGYHLPINTDSIIAEAIANELGNFFKDSFIAPVLPYSASYEHSDFPGSISLQSTTIISIIKDVVHSLERMGIQKCIIINGHGGNYLLGNISQEMNVDRHRLMVAPNRKHWENAYKNAGISSSISEDMHAGEGETSILLHLSKEKNIVKKDKYVDVESSRRDFLTVVGMKPYTKTGAIGYPTRANAEKGEMLLHHLVKQIESTVREFVNLGT
jgi:creatinine amidohydrolase